MAAVPLANRATIGNMSPEFGSTCAIFPIDDETLPYLRLTGRPAEQVALVEAYAKEQGLWHDPGRASRATPSTSSSTCPRVVPSLAGPKRPQDRVALADAKTRVPRGARRLRARWPAWTTSIAGHVPGLRPGRRGANGAAAGDRPRQARSGRPHRSR